MNPEWIVYIFAVAVIAFLLAWGIVLTILRSQERAEHMRAISEANHSQSRAASAIRVLTAQAKDHDSALRQALLASRELEQAHTTLLSKFGSLEGEFDSRIHQAKIEIDDLKRQLRLLSRWQTHVDAEAALRHMESEVRRIEQIASSDARILISNADFRSRQLLDTAHANASDLDQRAQAALATAQLKADEVIAERTAEIERELDETRLLSREARAQCVRIIANAEAGAKAIAGEAWDARNRVHELQEAADAIRNTIDGYGSKYLVPAYSLMDDVATELAGSNPALRFNLARERSREMVKAGEAATSDATDLHMRGVACRFLLDAFNGKTDAIVNAARREDIGTLRQRMRDAFGLVNMHGAGFHGTKISKGYLDARLEEVQWACVLQELRAQSREEQRQFREQMREDAAAKRFNDQRIEQDRRDAEETQRQSELAQRRAEEAQRRAEEIESIMQLQRAEFESEKAVLSEEAQERYLSKVSDMQTELEAFRNTMNTELEAVRKAAERTPSLAQQTRAGHVYVIANVGAFGEGVFKIGMTRRGDDHWRDRVDELGDASVPFEYSVHAVIKSDDAPTLERRLHWHFALWQVNKRNHRKEFFRVSAEKLRTEISQLGVDAQWSIASELAPAEYLETLEIERRIESDPIERAAWMRSQKKRFGQLAQTKPAWLTGNLHDRLLDDADV